MARDSSRSRGNPDRPPFSLRRATVAHLWWRSVGEGDAEPADIEDLFAALLTAYAEENSGADATGDDADGRVRRSDRAVPTPGRVRRLFSPHGDARYAAR